VAFARCGAVKLFMQAPNDVRKPLPHLLLSALCVAASACGGPPLTPGASTPDVTPDVVEDVVQGCTTDEECEAELAPLAPCEVAVCRIDTATCRAETAETGALCEDGSVCTVGDTCFGGTCLGGGPLECDDGNQSTDDTCDGVDGCANEARLGACHDGDECTIGDTCVDAVCVPEGQADCDDDNPCSIDGCDPSAGCVWTVRLGEACDDGDECTAGDVCATGSVCQGSAEVNCDDFSPCTDDVCDIFNGCLNTFNVDGCDDADPCTYNDACNEGLCEGKDDPCDDGSECTLDSCHEVDGCQHLTHFGPCDDGSLCTVNDTCATGTCVGTSNTCDDDNGCTIDYCHPVDGCQHSFLGGASCEDGNPCTTLDACDDFGACLPGPSPDCTDGNDCTHDACSIEEGCVHTATSALCDDADACTDDDVCREGLCEGEPIVCEDNNPCTLNACSFVTGCVFVDNDDPCDDLDPCTTDDVCIEGGCYGDASDCDDGEPCTLDTCIGEGECDHIVMSGACEDGNPCTSGDVCVAGICTAGLPTDCDDDDQCTLDACTLDAGCLHVQAPSCGVPTGWLIVNEFDYEQSGDDARDFVELIVVGDQTVELADYRLELVDGSTGEPYATYQLSLAIDQLHPGEMVIIGPPSIVSPLQGTAATILAAGNFLQNGGTDGDALRIVRTLNGVESVMDAVSYEAAVFLSNEGNSHVGFDGEFAEEDEAFRRCPDGTDTDENALDFTKGAPTPGEANDC